MVLIAGLAAGLAVQGLVSGAQALFGIKEYRKGKERMAALERPEYEIPEEVAANLEAAKGATPGGIPDPAMQGYIRNIRGLGAGTMENLEDRGLGLAGASGIFREQATAYRSLLGLDAQARDRQKEVIANNLAQARLTSAGFKERQFDINMFQPYMQDYMSAQSMMGSGMQNIGLGIGGISNIAGIGLGGLGGGQAGAGVAQPSSLAPGASSLNLQQNPNPMQAYGGW